MNKVKKIFIKGIFTLILTFIFSFNITFFTYASTGNVVSMEEIDALEEALELLKEGTISYEYEEAQNYKRNSEDILYTQGLSLTTLYRHNKLIKSSFKFKIDVKENNKIQISADGIYRDAGYIWGDDYEIYIYDKYGEQKFFDRVTYGGDVYKDVNNLLRKLSSLDIVVGDNIRIDSRNYNDTVRFTLKNGTYYTNGSNTYFKGLPARQQKFAMTRQGFIKQIEDLIIPRGMFYQALILNIKNENTGKVTEFKLNFEDKSEGRIRFNTDRIGAYYDYVWNENYVIYAYDSKGKLKAGAVLRKGAPVEETIYTIIDSFNSVKVSYGDRMSFGTTGALNSLKLIENSGRYYSTPFLSLFTCSNSNFSNGVNGKTEFIITDYGLMETLYE